MRFLYNNTSFGLVSMADPPTHQFRASIQLRQQLRQLVPQFILHLFNRIIFSPQLLGSDLSIHRK